MGVYRVLRGGNPAKLKNLVVRIREGDVSVYSSDHNENTVLHYAALFGRNEVVETFLLKAHDPNKAVNQTNAWGETPLHLAALGGDPTTVDLLLEEGAYPQALTEKGETVIHYAAVGRYETLAHILSSLPSLEIASKDDKGFLPLDYALRYCRLENAFLLLLAGSPHTENPELRWIEETTLRLFSSRGLSYEELLWALPVVLRRNPDVLLSDSPLRSAVIGGLNGLDPERAVSVLGVLMGDGFEGSVMRALLPHFPNLPVDLTVLIKVLLGEDVEIPERVSLPEWAVKPLLDAVKRGSRDAFLLLARSHLPINRSRLPDLIVAFDMDLDEGDLKNAFSRIPPQDFISLLMELDDPEKACRGFSLYGPERLTPHLNVALAFKLLKACDEEQRALLLSFLSGRSLSDYVDDLLRGGDPEVVKTVMPLLKPGAFLKVVKKLPHVLREAVEEGRLKATFPLMKALIREVHRSGPMDPRWLEAFTLLLSTNPSLVEEVDELGNSLLHYAAFYPHLGAVKVLVKRGAARFLNVQNRSGYTPLALALFSGGREVAHYLKSLGARL